MPEASLDPQTRTEGKQADTAPCTVPPSGAKPEAKPQPYAEACSQYVNTVLALSGTFPLLIEILGAMVRESGQACNLVLQEHATSADDGSTRVIHDDWVTAFQTFDRRYDDALATRDQLPKTMIITMVSEFDVLVGKLIATFLRDKPEAVNSSEKKFTLAELRAAGSFEEAENYIVEKEVESVLRKSHADHFEWLERQLGIPLKKGLDAWPRFVEVTERRNLLVHTGGVVSSQYLEVCKRHGAPVEDGVKPGSIVGVPGKYLSQSRQCLLEIAIKLSQVVWRKCRPEETEAAESHLIECTFKLLQRGHYCAVAAILSFFVKERKWEGRDNEMICTINLAQALKWTKDSNGCAAILKDLDPKILASKYQLAIAVLRDDFDEASRIIKSSGESLSVDMDDYATWPLFREFRKSEAFASAFAARFGRTFAAYEQKIEARKLAVITEVRKQQEAGTKK